MRTPTEFQKNLKNGIITKQMLAEALFSVNKRAKNYRNKENQYRSNRYIDFKYVDSAYEKKQEMYDRKEQLLAILTPNCIHKEKQSRLVSVNEYDYEFDLIPDDEVVISGEYRDDTGYYVQYKKYYKDFDRYYLFYDMGNHSFHTPIESREVNLYCKKYHIEVEVLNGSIITFGKDTNELVSVQFVDKLLKLINENNYKLVN